MANDPFISIPTITIAGVSDLSYTINDPDPDGTENQTMTYEAKIQLSNGSHLIQQGNVVPHLTAAKITGLQVLMTRLRGKAETAWGDAP